MDQMLMRTAVAVGALFATAGQAHAARGFAAEVACEGVFAVGDDVPFDVVFADLDGKRDKIFVTITLDVPGGYNNVLVASAIVKLEAGEERSFFRVHGLPADGPTGSYSMFMNASSEDGTEISVCDITVE